MDHEILLTLTPEELEQHKDTLLSEIQSIEAQLADTNRIDFESGERMSDREYHVWRRKAVFARTKLLEDYRKVKARVKEVNREQAGTENAGFAGRLERVEEKIDRILEILEPTSTHPPGWRAAIEP